MSGRVYVPSYPTPPGVSGLGPGFRAGGFGAGGGGGGAPVGQVWPVFSNFDGDTVGESAAALNAKSTHHAVIGDTNVQLVDYGAMNAMTGNILTNCFVATGPTEAAGDELIMDSGFTPSNGRVLICEGIFWVSGSGSQSEFYIRSSNSQEGIHAYLAASGSAYVRTATGGSWTAKYGPIATTGTPHNQGWHLFLFQYNYTTNQIFFRVIELGSDSQDSNWVGGGTISPTFDANTEHVSFFAIARSGPGSLCAVAQSYYADQLVSGYNMAAKGTHNYVDPTPPAGYGPVELDFESDSVSSEPAGWSKPDNRTSICPVINQRGDSGGKEFTEYDHAIHLDADGSFGLSWELVTPLPAEGWKIEIGFVSENLVQPPHPNFWWGPVNGLAWTAGTDAIQIGLAENVDQSQITWRKDSSNDANTKAQANFPDSWRECSKSRAIYTAATKTINASWLTADEGYTITHDETHTTEFDEAEPMTHIAIWGGASSGTLADFDVVYLWIAGLTADWPTRAYGTP